MNDAMPYLLVGAIVVVLVIGIVQYCKFLSTPWDEWDEISQGDPPSSDEKD